jgi:hypothetical protein
MERHEGMQGHEGTPEAADSGGTARLRAQPAGPGAGCRRASAARGVSSEGQRGMVAEMALLSPKPATPAGSLKTNCM